MCNILTIYFDFFFFFYKYGGENDKITDLVTLLEGTECMYVFFSFSFIFCLIHDLLYKADFILFLFLIFKLYCNSSFVSVSISFMHETAAPMP